MLGKKLKLALTFLFALISLSLATNIFASQFTTPFKLSSASVLLMDANNGQIVNSQNPDHRFQPASLAKVMTLFLIFDALEQGTVKLDDEVVISKKAAQKEGSKMYLREGEKVPLVELIKGIAVVSGNDASVAIAEGVFGSEKDLVDKMNQKLRDLNLQNSKFQTVDGWPVPDQYTTAYDMAILSRAFIQQHPEAMQYHLLKEFTHSDIVLHNRNGLILHDPSVDGLKTGYVEEAGYHLIATAVRENQRYIAVIMGAEKIETREKEAMQLLNFGFENLITVKLFKKDDILSHLSVLKGNKAEVGLRPTKDGVITLPTSEQEFIDYELETPNQLEAPIEIDQKLGHVLISYRTEILKRIPLVANENIQQAETKIPVKDPVTSTGGEQSYMLYFIFILFCVLVILYFFTRWNRHSFRKTNASEEEIIKQRLDKILNSTKNE